VGDACAAIAATDGVFMRVISDLRPLLARVSSRAQQHPIIDEPSKNCSRAILKIEPHTVSEILGYRLAGVAGARVPNAEAFLFSPRDGERLGKYFPNDLGMLIEYQESWQPISREEAIARDPGAAAAAYALCMFDRFEWGEFGLSGDRVFFVDLERLLPGIEPRFLLTLTQSEERIDYLHRVTDSYMRSTESPLEAIEEARDFGILPDVQRALLQLATLSDEQWVAISNIEPHPLAEEISPFFGRAARHRLAVTLRLIGVPPTSIRR
jgi:hypothetical protein